MKAVFKEWGNDYFKYYVGSNFYAVIIELELINKKFKYTCCLFSYEKYNNDEHYKSKSFDNINNAKKYCDKELKRDGVRILEEEYKVLI